VAIYQRGKTYWYSFTFNGRRVQKSTRVQNAKEAENIEKAAWVQLARGEVGIQDRERFTVGELLDRLERRWRLEGKWTVMDESKKKRNVQNESMLKKTREDWGTKMADEITADDFEGYMLKRRTQDYAVATTNRILQCLRSAYKMANISWPRVKLPSEKGNKRTGFFTPEQMEKVLSNLPDDGLRDFIRFCYCTGTRRGEVAGLTWAMVEGNELHIPGDICKNRESRVLPLTGSLAQIIERRRLVRSFKSNGTTALSQHVFHRGDGFPILEFRKSWRTACKKAGCGNLLCHDMRRSAARDMIRAGITESVAMGITGHKTRSMFERYNIATTSDVKAALEKTAAYRAG
jgi:integrase